MSYDIAINKAWEELGKLRPANNLSIKFLADEYAVDIEAKKILSSSSNVPVKDFTAILLLHYLAVKLKGLPRLTGVWLPFRELSGVEGYLPAFRKRAIEPLIRKYGREPKNILQVLNRLPAEKADGADVAIILQAFQGVPVLLKLWRQDEEFAPDANMFFDRSITAIFCTEDIVVLAGFVAESI
jgi:hypothetical protein